MRPLRITLPLLLAAVLVAAPAPATAADVFRVDFRGGVAIGVWTTCPVWEVGAVCEETVVIASDAHTFEHFPGGREHGHGPRVVLQRFRYEVVDLGDGDLLGRPTWESFGGTDDAAVRIDRLSRSATATAAVPMNTTDYEADTTSTETASLTATWTGAGERVEIDEGYRVDDRTVLDIARTRGWERAATATGTIDGAPIPGAPDLAGTTIVNVRQGQLTVYRRTTPR